jgi:hypothetical protein
VPSVIQGRRTGYYTTGDGNGKIIEYETFTCGHCQHVTIVAHGATLADLGMFCLACARPCCKTCTKKMAAGGMCDPFEKKFERAEAAAQSRRSIENAFAWPDRPDGDFRSTT